MHLEGKQTVHAVAAACKLNTISHDVKHEQSQRADNFGLRSKILDEPMYHSRNLSLRSMRAINMKEFPNTSNGAENSYARKYNPSRSESEAIQQLEYVSWKYKNPYSVSVSNHTDYGRSTTLENILKEDEPQEGRAKESILSNCREYLATYQESCGTPRTEYSFAALIVVMAQATARFLLALIYVIVNVVPVIQMFSFILRFVLDKIIDIRRTKNFQDATVKFAILVVQLFSVYFCLIFILGIVILPIVQMAIDIASKLVMRNWIAVL